MKAFFKLLLRIIVWTCGIILVLVGIFWLTMAFNLPKTTVIVACTLLIALTLAIIFARRIFVRRRHREQIQKIVTLDTTGMEGEGYNTGSTLLENRWERAISIIRTSYLGRWGNPLYALPWYMLMGKTGAGKSSAVKYAGLNSMQTDVSPDTIEHSTRNCDWHFFRNAVIMDTAGRYAVHLNETEDSAEWRQFLTRLAKYRRKEPLNGLVLAVPADTLYDTGTHLIDEARCLRRRIDEIMRILGAKFPVYLMVTKIDLPAGMANLLENLPYETKQEGCGVFIQSPEKKELSPIDVQIDHALNNMTQRLQSICLYKENTAENYSPHRLLAWEELHAMFPALKTYAIEVFASNPYQETPLLRGIFFSSALRTTQEKSYAFPTLSHFVRRVFSLQERVGGIFLHNFFNSILPKDRKLYRPIAEYIRWRSSIRILMYSVLLLSTFTICGLFFLSYQHNIHALNTLNIETFTVDSHTTPTQNILNFENFYRKDATLEKNISHQFLPNMGFTAAYTAYEKYVKELNTAFIETILTESEKNNEAKYITIGDNTDDKEVFTLISNLVWRYDLLVAAEKGASFEDMLKIPAMPQAMLNGLGIQNTQLGTSLAYTMTRFIYNIKDVNKILQFKEIVMNYLQKMPAMQAHSLQWITHRAGTLSALTPVYAHTFWPNLPKETFNDMALDPVYTTAGMTVTLEYLNNITNILAENKKTENYDISTAQNNEQDAHTTTDADTNTDTTTTKTDATKIFLQWYAAQYLKAWENFAIDFVQTTQTLRESAVPALQDSAQLMSTINNPYFKLLRTMSTELEAIKDYLESPPAWLNDMDVLAQALATMDAVSPTNTASLPERLQRQLKGFYHDTLAQTSLDLREKDAKAKALPEKIQPYLDSLHELVKYTSNDSLAFTLVQQALPSESNKDASQSLLVLANSNAQALNTDINAQAAQNSPCTLLTMAPMKFFVTFLAHATSREIQKLWEGSVLSKAGKLTPSQLQQGLFAEQGGLVRDFVNTTLQGFLTAGITGYESNITQNIPIIFTKEFLTFLNTGMENYTPARTEYLVNIATVPIDVNQYASETPYAVELTLQCAREQQSMMNYNSPTSKSFTWTQGSCGDTSLSIRFKSLTLEILYAGENGFLNFLNDFQYGKKTFHATDFPSHQSVLEKLNINDITLQYTFSNIEDILKSYRFDAGELPFTIIENTHTENTTENTHEE